MSKNYNEVSSQVAAVRTKDHTLSVKGSRAIYCPHCGYMFTDTPVSKYGIYRCRSCHGDFYLYSRNASDKKRRGVLV